MTLSGPVSVRVVHSSSIGLSVTVTRGRLKLPEWDLDWLQPLWKTFELEPQRNRLLVETLARDPRVAKIFIEPHLKQSLGLTSDKIRFQGCRAARHDDHIHLQL